MKRNRTYTQKAHSWDVARPFIQSCQLKISYTVLINKHIHCYFATTHTHICTYVRSCGSGAFRAFFILKSSSQNSLEMSWRIFQVLAKKREPGWYQQRKIPWLPFLSFAKSSTVVETFIGRLNVSPEQLHHHLRLIQHTDLVCSGCAGGWPSGQ